MPLLVQQDAQKVKGRVELIVLLPQGIVELNSSLRLDFHQGPSGTDSSGSASTPVVARPHSQALL